LLPDIIERRIEFDDVPGKRALNFVRKTKRCVL
jgi:hypothetical protein